MPSTDQLDLAERLVADDERALEDVLRAYGPAILSIVSRRYRGVLQTHDVEDLLSIGLYRLWKSRSRLDAQRGSLRAWLFQIVDNAARDVLRHGWHKARSMEVKLPHEAANGQASVTRKKDDAEVPLTPQQQEIRDIVESLPASQRAIILADSLAPDGTASSRDLGHELGLPASTVRVYRKRALDTLRTELQRRGYCLHASGSADHE